MVRVTGAVDLTVSTVEVAAKSSLETDSRYRPKGRLSKR